MAGQNASQTSNGNTSASEAADTIAQLQLQSPAQQDKDSSSEHKQQHQRATEASANSNTQEGQSMPSSKGKKTKKSKRDYAAWAGATAETRALATAHHNGNPDLESVVASSARPRIPKQSKRLQHIKCKCGGDVQLRVFLSVHLSFNLTLCWQNPCYKRHVGRRPHANNAISNVPHLQALVCLQYSL